jgi:hypothetical protein
MKISKKQETFLKRLLENPNENMIDTITITRNLENKDKLGWVYKDEWKIKAERKNSYSIIWYDADEQKVYESFELIRDRDGDLPF